MISGYCFCREGAAAGEASGGAPGSALAPPSGVPPRPTSPLPMRCRAAPRAQKLPAMLRLTDPKAPQQLPVMRRPAAPNWAPQQLLMQQGRTPRLHIDAGFRSVRCWCCWPLTGRAGPIADPARCCMLPHRGQPYQTRGPAAAAVPTRALRRR